MNKFIGTRIGVIIFTMLVCVIAFGGISYASGTFNKTVPVSGSVVLNAPDLKLYSDVACSVPVESIALPAVIQGDSALIEFYIKNEGTKDYSAIVFTSDIAVGTLSVGPSISGQPNVMPSLAKGASIKATLTWNVPLDGAVGNLPPVEANFSCNY